MAIPERRPSPWAVHGALILAQVMFGGGSVVGKLGVEKFNPLLFALIRECVAGPLLPPVKSEYKSMTMSGWRWLGVRMAAWYQTEGPGY